MLIECARCGKAVSPTDDCCSACGFDPVNDPCRFGPYEILERRGRGGLSVVFKARKNGTVAALKILESTRPKRVDQFAREATVLAALSHPNVVKVYDSGEVDGHRFLALEFVDGPGLDVAIRKRMLDAATAATITARAARAFQHLHERGFVHRDVTPGNILLGPDHDPKISDFGLTLRIEEVRKLAPGVTGGTPVYMSPEQASANHAAVDGRSDVYGLGAVLHEALAGRPPFTGTDTLEILRRIRLEPFVMPEGVEPGLAGILRQALEKDPDGRFDSMADFASALESWAGRHEGRNGS
ncbi:MAG TPA: serine/threonine-protein kinase [Planctomycetota bacterium]|nr:serine/threonine-protein kinase [Planctomycetota bacterium]